VSQASLPNTNQTHKPLAASIFAAPILGAALALAAFAQEGKPMPEPNRLANERSPYLLQHARNPVDWYPWGAEAFEKAKREDKPVFLSVGYSSCHWCHVMEHESFEDEEVARLLNDGFVSIKVDREERPDVDDVYMRVTQLLTGSGGWPMTVFMTPDKRPFFAGTYFPKTARYGQPSFTRLLEEIAKTWRTRRADVERSADEIAAAASAPARPAAEAGPAKASEMRLDASLVKLVGAAMERRFDERQGGFGHAPKFPPHHALRLFLSAAAGEGERRMALVTLDKMAAGGLHDQVGGGFHRYSTDDEWLVPHFEKMLYDNAMLVRAYVDAFEATGKPCYRRIAEDTLAWVAREMTDPEGGFYSALDADSEGEEGKYYVWTPTETAQVLGERAAAFDAYYDITARGNWEGKSIPRVLGDYDEAPRFERERALLLEARRRRVAPGLDDKVLASWNGLMIGALARAAAVLKDERYGAAAEKAARFLLASMRTGDGGLFRSWRRGVAGGEGYLDDYAYAADGLLDLFEATGDARWREAAEGLADRMLRDFADERQGGFFSTSTRHERLLFRQSEAFDGALPSDNGVAARVLARLALRAGAAKGGDRYGAAADRTIRAFTGLLGRGAPAMLTLVGAIAVRGEVGAVTLPAEPVVMTGPDPVSVTAALAGKAAPGKKLVAVVTLVIAPGFHVNADDPGLDYLVPTRVAVLPGEVPIAAGVPFYPVAVERRVAFADAPVRLFEGRAEIRVPLEVAAGAAPAVGALRLQVKYQACDETRCLAPVERVVEVPVEIGPQ
jgi:uncharacterized protein YyaL (SSP411 family)